MKGSTAVAILAALSATGLAPTATAQVAAETGQVLSGVVSSQGGAARGLGSAITGSIDRAASRIGSGPDGRSAARQGSSAGASQHHVLPRGGNDLKDTDAPTYQVGNSAAISVSGRLVPSAGTTCVENCAGEQARR